MKLGTWIVGVAVACLSLGIGYVYVSSDTELYADINRRVISAVDRDQSPTPIKFISTLEAYSLFQTKKAIFLDARPEREFQYMHIPGARSAFYAEVKKNKMVRSIDRNQLLVVYCASSKCPMAELLANALHELQFKKVYVYAGGMQEWTGSNYPTQRFQFPQNM